MKAILFACFVGVSSLSKAQGILPEFEGRVGFFRKDSVLVELEQKKSRTEVKSGGPYGKTKAFSMVDGVRSNIIILPMEDIQFVVRTSDNRKDPISIINIFKLESDEKGNRRFVLVSSVGAYSGKKENIEFLAFEAKRYKDSAYIFKSTRGFAMGEYAITLDGSRDIFNLFSVR